MLSLLASLLSVLHGFDEALDGAWEPFLTDDV